MLADVAFSLLQWAILTVLESTADRLHGKYPWLDDIFQNNELQREISETLSIIRRMETTQQDSERDSFVAKWATAAASSTATVRDTMRAVKCVARAVYYLQKSGVQDVVVCASGKDPVAVGSTAFENGAERMLQGIVDLARSDTIVEEVFANGLYAGGGDAGTDSHARAHASDGASNDDGTCPDEILDKEQTARRFTYIASLVNVLHKKWSGNYPLPEDEDEREAMWDRLQRNICITWLVHEDAKQMDEELEEYTKVPMERLIEVLQCCEKRDGRSHLNVFVLGLKRQGFEQSTSKWLLTSAINESSQPTPLQNSTEQSQGNAGAVRRVWQSNAEPIVKFWDTPAFCLENVGAGSSTEILKQRMMMVNGISAVIFQADQPRQLQPAELKLIEQINVWFGGKLNDNLLITFESNPEGTEREKFEEQVQVWEAERKSYVAPIGAKNYFCFQVDDTMDQENAISVNRAEIQKARNAICNKNITNIQTKADIVEVLQKWRGAWDDKKREEIGKLADSFEERTESVRRLMSEPTALRAIYQKHSGPGELEIFSSGRCPLPLLARCRFPPFRSKTKPLFLVRGTCEDTRKFLAGFHGKSARGPKKNQWIENICDQDYKYTAGTTNRQLAPLPIFYMYQNPEALKREGIRKLKQMLGREKSLGLLKSAAQMS